MLFDSLEFSIFFPAVLLLFYALPHNGRWAMLLTASCFFYMFFKPVYILILGFTIVIDYFAALWIDRQNEPGRRRLFLVFSIIANLGVLAVFKYYNFIAFNLNFIASKLNAGHSLPFLSIVLPIGLSFHTFQAMSYTIEVYRGNQKPEKHFGIYALYVMFFPQLVAGPIERPQHVLHQFHEMKTFNYDNARSGLVLIAWGLIKKVVISNRLGLFVNYVYASPQEHTGIPLILATVFFAIQILCDFSGYSDIAVGTARMMGYELMTNFNFPFTSKSVTEFWRRWHISLSTWFNDYLFLPLATAKRDWGKMSVAFGLLVTFFLSGIWHGAGWTFVIYGLIHGFALIYEFYTKKQRKRIFSKLPDFLNNSMSTVVTFCFVAMSWIFFRSQNIGDAFYIIRHLSFDVLSQVRKIIFNEHLIRLKLLYLGQSSAEFMASLFCIILLLLVHYSKKDIAFDQWIISKTKGVRWTAYYLMVTIFVVLGVFNKSAFIYFQF